MEDLQSAYENLPQDCSMEEMKKTAEALVRRQYSPMLILDVPNFFQLTRSDMLSEFNRVMSLPESSAELKAAIGIADSAALKENHLRLLLNQYRLLCALRKNDGDAWKTVNELYEDD